MSSSPGWTAIVLAGGRSTRMGADKLAIDVDGASSLAHVLTDLGEVPVIVVGPQPELPTGVPTPIIVREDPPFSGPVAAIGAALFSVRTDVVAVIAGDMPFAVPVAARAVASLPPTADACVPVDGEGRQQYLCAAYRTGALVDATMAMGSLAGASMRQLLSGLTVVELPVPGDRLVDLDAPHDVERAHRIAETTTEGIADTGTP